jgi:hypothetical protein
MDGKLLGETVDLVALLDVVLLRFPEQPGGETQPVLAGRTQAQFVAVLLVPVLALDVLRRVDEVAGVVVRAVGIKRVVPEAVVVVVGVDIVVALEVGIGVGEIEIADLAFTVSAACHQLSSERSL